MELDVELPVCLINETWPTLLLGPEQNVPTSSSSVFHSVVTSPPLVIHIGGGISVGLHCPSWHWLCELRLVLVGESVHESVKPLLGHQY